MRSNEISACGRKGCGTSPSFIQKNVNKAVTVAVTEVTKIQVSPVP